MTLASVPSPPVPDQTSNPSLDCPPSLRRRGPATLDLHDPAGNTPGAAGAGLHLHSGERYTLRIRPQDPDDWGATVDVSLAEGETLRRVVPLVATSAGNGSKEYTATFLPRSGLRVPLPFRDELTITLVHDRWGSYSLVLSVVIWPRFIAQFLSVFGVVLLIAGRRITPLWQDKDSSLPEVAQSVANNPTFWLELSGLTLAGLVLLRVAGWIWLGIGGRTD